MGFVRGCPDHLFDVVLAGAQTRHVGTTDPVEAEPAAALALAAIGQEVPAIARMRELEWIDLPRRGVPVAIGIRDLDHPTFGDGDVERSRCPRSSRVRG